MKRFFSLLLSFAMLLSLAACGGATASPASPSAPSAGPKQEQQGAAPGAATPKPGSSAPVEEPAPATTLGSIGSDGYALFLDAGTFGKSAEVTVKPAEGALLDAFRNSGYELTGTPLSIDSSQYEGEIFCTEVTLTLPGTGSAEELNDYVFIYYDETANEFRTFFPDGYDLANGAITISLPHFSGWSGAKLSDEQKIDKFLDSYCTKQAISKGQSQQDAMALEPYIRLKAEALQLNKKATEDLIQSTINVLSGGFSGKFKGAIETGTKTVTAVVRGVYDDDASATESGLSDALNGAFMHAWDDLKYTERIDEIAGGEFAGGTASTVAANATGIYRMNEKLKSGDLDGAREELGGILMNIHPAAEITTKTANYLATRVNLEFTNWKANQIEELYHCFKNGGKDFWGNSVEPGDRESFLEYLNYPHGLTYVSGVQRFYNMDKFPEICEKYGWEFKKYEDMPQQYRDIFQQRAEAGLMEYFETRLAQEREAEKLVESEREVIRQLLGDFGALNPSRYRDFFGEASADDYDIDTRLSRLVVMRETISIYVDETALARSVKAGAENYGDLLNIWVDFHAKNTKQDAMDLFLKELHDRGMLKKEFEALLIDVPSLSEVEGKYSDGMMTVTDFYIPPELKEAIESGEDGEEGCDIDLSQIVGQTKDLAFELMCFSSDSARFIAGKNGSIESPDMTYDPKTGVFSTVSFPVEEDGINWTVTLSLTCTYSDEARTGVNVSGTMSETASGEYEGIKITCSIIGSRKLE